ncbi:hypothetical protein [Methanolobus sp.]|uniref:hypothetical protein n=1 Tax=Methanolobus sp. TaxID=1874737 RepID=UPI0025FCB265|nr:hypothetical protein [Methanolobus sp.]
MNLLLLSQVFVSALFGCISVVILARCYERAKGCSGCPVTNDNPSIRVFVWLKINSSLQKIVNSFISLNTALSLTEVPV